MVLVNKQRPYLVRNAQQHLVFVLFVQNQETICYSLSSLGSLTAMHALLEKGWFRSWPPPSLLCRESRLHAYGWLQSRAGFWPSILSFVAVWRQKIWTEVSADSQTEKRWWTHGSCQPGFMEHALEFRSQSSVINSVNVLELLEFAYTNVINMGE